MPTTKLPPALNSPEPQTVTERPTTGPTMPQPTRRTEGMPGPGPGTPPCPGMPHDPAHGMPVKKGA